MKTIYKVQWLEAGGWACITEYFPTMAQARRFWATLLDDDDVDYLYGIEAEAVEA